MFRCPLCIFAHYQRVRVKIHLRQAHIDQVLEAQREALTPTATLYDAEGKLIEQMPGGADTSEIEAALAADDDPND